MAEYIDRQDLIKFLDNIQQPKMPITEGFKFITIDDAIRVVSERPIADVIERSEIDKAIEEIEKTENTQAHTFYDGDINTKGAFNDGMEKALEILKRHIGEDKENE